jgi:exodeoxyribonuclease VII small subunit
MTRSKDGRDVRSAAYNITMPDEAPLSFEAGLQLLETIVKEMEGGDLPLERALELFERGVKLSETCRKQLEEAETRVEILMRRAGEMQPQPFRDAKS